MELDDKKFEEYLSEFRPREPRALDVSEAGFWRRWGARVAVAAVLVLVAGAMLIWMREQMRGRAVARVPPVERTIAAPQSAARRDIASEVSLGRLEMLSNRDPAQLDRALAEASRNLLPHVDRADSTLHSLDHD
jgi:cytochrome c biogenesis protein ResB